MSPRRTPALLALTTLAGLAAAITPAATAQAAPPAASTGPGGTVIASGLHNPRQLSIGPGGAVYVAEAGLGGDGACIANPEGGQMCVGATGSITRITRGQQERVVTGLPSLAGPDGGGAQGPGDVHVTGRWVTIGMGLGGSPDARASLGADGARLGTVLHGRLGGDLAVIADPVAWEALHNPAGEDLDSNPTGVLPVGNSGQVIVVDAGANALEAFGRGDRTLAVLPPLMAEAPPFLGLPPGTRIPAQSVPTDVERGPDGALYVSELTGFPFPVGGSRIWRVEPGRAPTVYADGLTTVTSIAWRGDDLYAVQLSDGGLLSQEPGSLRRVDPDGEHAVVAGGLFMPYGVAVHGRNAYVSTCSIAGGPIPGVCPDGGEVRAVVLR